MVIESSIIKSIVFVTGRMLSHAGPHDLKRQRNMERLIGTCGLAGAAARSICRKLCKATTIDEAARGLQPPRGVREPPQEGRVVSAPGERVLGGGGKSCQPPPGRPDLLYWIVMRLALQGTFPQDG